MSLKTFKRVVGAILGLDLAFLIVATVIFGLNWDANDPDSGCSSRWLWVIGVFATAHSFIQGVELISLLRNAHKAEWVTCSDSDTSRIPILPRECNYTQLHVHVSGRGHGDSSGCTGTTHLFIGWFFIFLAGFYFIPFLHVFRHNEECPEKFPVFWRFSYCVIVYNFLSVLGHIYMLLVMRNHNHKRGCNHNSKWIIALK